MRYTAKMGSDAMIHMPNFIKIGLGILKLIREHTTCLSCKSKVCIVHTSILLLIYLHMLVKINHATNLVIIQNKNYVELYGTFSTRGNSGLEMSLR
jgi:hypothetical protein